MFKKVYNIFTLSFCSYKLLSFSELFDCSYHHFSLLFLDRCRGSRVSKGDVVSQRFGYWLMYSSSFVAVSIYGQLEVFLCPLKVAKCVAPACVILYCRSDTFYDAFGFTSELWSHTLSGKLLFLYHAACAGRNIYLAWVTLYVCIFEWYASALSLCWWC
jgi:hypothetical protein